PPLGDRPIRPPHEVNDCANRIATRQVIRSIVDIVDSYGTNDANRIPTAALHRPSTVRRLIGEGEADPLMTVTCSGLIWRIQLLGGLRAARGGQVVTRFPTRKTGALLAYLACHLDREQPREVLAELL